MIDGKSFPQSFEVIFEFSRPFMIGCNPNYYVPLEDTQRKLSLHQPHKPPPRNKQQKNR